MKILKYKSFSETMQFAVLKNADKLAKEENDRRKAKREEESNVDIVIETKDKPNFGDDIQMDPEEGSEEMSPEEGSEEMSPEEGSEEMSPEEGSGEPF